jgi:hypothetical protein
VRQEQVEAEREDANDLAAIPVDAVTPAPDAVSDLEPIVAPVPGPAPAPGPSAAPAPAPAPAGDPSPQPEATPAPLPTPTSTPTPTPEPEPEPVRTAAPTMHQVLDTSAPIPSSITGTGVAGAAVVLIDESDAPLSETTVASDGTFRADIPADLLRAGMTVRAVQTAPDELASVASAPVGPFTAPAPVITTEAGTLEGVLVDGDFDGIADDLRILLDGLRGATVTVSVDGVATGNRHVLSGDPLLRVVRNTTPGTHVIGIRYLDPASGRMGRLAEFTVTAVAREAR